MGSGQGEGTLLHMAKEEEVNGDFDYQSWYAQKRIADTQERVCRCRAWKAEKDVVTLGLLHVATNSFQGGCLKQAQKSFKEGQKCCIVHGGAS